MSDWIDVRFRLPEIPDNSYGKILLWVKDVGLTIGEVRRWHCKKECGQKTTVITWQGSDHEILYWKSVKPPRGVT